MAALEEVFSTGLCTELDCGVTPGVHINAALHPSCQRASVARQINQVFKTASCLCWQTDGECATLPCSVIFIVLLCVCVCVSRLGSLTCFFNSRSASPSPIPASPSTSCLPPQTPATAPSTRGDTAATRWAWSPWWNTTWAATTLARSTPRWRGCPTWDTARSWSRACRPATPTNWPGLTPTCKYQDRHYTTLSTRWEQTPGALCWPDAGFWGKVGGVYKLICFLSLSKKK